MAGIKKSKSPVMRMYEDGDMREQKMNEYTSLAIDRGQYGQLTDTVTSEAVASMFFGLPADQLDGLMGLSPNEIANRYAAARREEQQHA